MDGAAAGYLRKRRRASHSKPRALALADADAKQEFEEFWGVEAEEEEGEGGAEGGECGHFVFGWEVRGGLDIWSQGLEDEEEKEE